MTGEGAEHRWEGGYRGAKQILAGEALAPCLDTHLDTKKMILTGHSRRLLYTYKQMEQKWKIIIQNCISHPRRYKNGSVGK